MKVYGTEVFFSQLNNKDRLQALGNLLRNPRESMLYGQLNTIKNVLLIDSNVRQPLANGLEFNTYMDVSAAVLIQKNSQKTDNGDVRDFSINNFKGFVFMSIAYYCHYFFINTFLFFRVSLAVNRRFEVHLNNDNRLALKKKAYGNFRLRTQVSGKKEPGRAEYNLQFTDNKDIPLLVFE